MKSVEQHLEEEKRVNQAIVDLLDEALQKVGYSEDVINGLTISGKIDFLVRAAQHGMQLADGTKCLVCKKNPAEICTNCAELLA